MPGFPRGLESISDLASNINIITGVNASGKSSIARVIQQLIWHDDTKGLEVDGSVILDEDLWGIKIDSEKVIVQRNGNQDQINGLPTLEGQHRYLLALHKLVEGKENDLAKEIAKQSIGGFDLDAAQKNLGYSSKSSNRSISEYKKFEEAEGNYKNVRDQQRELKKDEGKLINLNLEKDNAQYAARLNEFYNKLADYLEANSEYTQLLNQMNEFPESMEKLSGEEYTRIQELESDIEECQSKIEKAKDEIAKSQKGLKLLIIPEDGINDKTISEIEKRLELLSDYERDIRDCDTQIARFESVESEALKGIDTSINPKDWKTLNIDDVSGLDKMLQDAHQVLGEKAFLLKEIEFLEEEAKKYEKNDRGSEIFIQGIKTLSDWLKEPTNTIGIPLSVVILISLLGLVTALVTLFVGWVGLLGIVLIAIVLLYAYSKSSKNSNSISVREKYFINSGIKPPSHWNTENVVSRI
ncbi:MAG: hypothetical protein PHE33_05955, partial [Bacteroidales bacterium]|nr:hypothetical protein [Bacteroidales bacterium]